MWWIATTPLAPVGAAGARHTPRSRGPSAPRQPARALAAGPVEGAPIGTTRPTYTARWVTSRRSSSSRPMAVRSPPRSSPLPGEPALY